MVGTVCHWERDEFSSEWHRYRWFSIWKKNQTGHPLSPHFTSHHWTPHTMFYNQCQVDHRLNVQGKTTKLLWNNIKENILIASREGFLRQERKSTNHKGKSGKFSYIWIILQCQFIKRHFKDSKIRSCKRREDTCIIRKTHTLTSETGTPGSQWDGHRRRNPEQNTYLSRNLTKKARRHENQPHY